MTELPEGPGLRRRWCRAGPLLVLAYLGPVVVTAFTVHGFTGGWSWFVAIVAGFVPLLAVTWFFWSHSPERWSTLGALVGFLAGGYLGASAWVHAHIGPWFAAVAVLVLAFASAECARFASLDWSNQLGRDLVEARVHVPVPLRVLDRSFLCGPGWLRLDIPVRAPDGSTVSRGGVPWRAVLAVQPGEVVVPVGGPADGELDRGERWRRHPGPAVRFLLAGGAQLIVPVPDAVLVAAFCTALMADRRPRPSGFFALLRAGYIDLQGRSPDAARNMVISVCVGIGGLLCTYGLLRSSTTHLGFAAAPLSALLLHRGLRSLSAAVGQARRTYSYIRGATDIEERDAERFDAEHLDREQLDREQLDREQLDREQLDREQLDREQLDRQEPGTDSLDREKSDAELPDADVPEREPDPVPPDWWRPLECAVLSPDTAVSAATHDAAPATAGPMAAEPARPDPGRGAATGQPATPGSGPRPEPEQLPGPRRAGPTGWANWTAPGVTPPAGLANWEPPEAGP